MNAMRSEAEASGWNGSAENRPMIEVHTSIQHQVPPDAGLYILFMQLWVASALPVGALGEHRFEAGYYAYIGSAYGPGGLAARIQRHLKAAARKTRHWHIDYLLPHITVVSVGWSKDGRSSECEWATVLEACGDRLPPRFGASDCRCGGHLIASKSGSIMDLGKLLPGGLHVISTEPCGGIAMELGGSHLDTHNSNFH